MKVTTDPAVKPDVVIRLTWDEACYMKQIVERGMDVVGFAGSLAYDVARALTHLGVNV